MSQPTGKTVGNVSFPQFRADLNDGLDALFTNNSGSSPPAALGNSDYGHYFDTSDNTFKIKDSTTGGSGNYASVYKLQNGEVRHQGSIVDALPASGSFVNADEKKSLLINQGGVLSFDKASPYRFHALAYHLEATDENGHNYQRFEDEDGNLISTGSHAAMPRRLNYLEFDTGNQVSLNSQSSPGFGTSVAANRNVNAQGPGTATDCTVVRLRKGTHYLCGEFVAYRCFRYVIRVWDATNSTYIGRPSAIHYFHQTSPDLRHVSLKTRIVLTQDTNIQFHGFQQKVTSEARPYAHGFGYDGIDGATNKHPNTRYFDVHGFPAPEVIFSTLEVWTV